MVEEPTTVEATALESMPPTVTDHKTDGDTMVLETIDPRAETNVVLFPDERRPVMAGELAE